MTLGTCFWNGFFSSIRFQLLSNQTLFHSMLVVITKICHLTQVRSDNEQGKSYCLKHKNRIFMREVVATSGLRLYKLRNVRGWWILTEEVRTFQESFSSKFQRTQTLLMICPFRYLLEVSEMEKRNEQDLISCNIHASSSVPLYYTPLPTIFQICFSSLPLRSPLAGSSTKASIPNKKNRNKKKRRILPMKRKEKPQWCKKKEKQPLEHSRLVSRLYEFFIRQMNCSSSCLLALAFFPPSQALCAFLKMFFFERV